MPDAKAERGKAGGGSLVVGRVVNCEVGGHREGAVLSFLIKSLAFMEGSSGETAASCIKEGS